MYLTKHGLFLKSQFLTKSYFNYSCNVAVQWEPHRQNRSMFGVNVVNLNFELWDSLFGVLPEFHRYSCLHIQCHACISPI